MGMTLMMSAAGKLKITRIDPTDWYVGMKNPCLQLMVYGKDVKSVERVTTDYPGVTITDVVRLDSPNYLLVYLNLKDAKPGEMVLRFDQTKVAYQLKQREMAGDRRMGFSNADVLYMLMPDRFACSGNYLPSAAQQKKGKKVKAVPAQEQMNSYVVDRSKPSLRHGGDLEGIRQHLDYFNQLGVTALWFTPVLENNSPDSNGYSTYHGYATTDYYRVDPRFGTNADYRKLTDEAHAHGLKIVMDMIFNHCGFEHPWVADLPTKDWLNCPEWLNEKQSSGRDPMTGYTANADGTEPAKSKYLQTSYKLTPVKDPYASKIDLKETVDGWFVPSMPDLNQRNEHVMTYLIQNSIWWIETVGIDDEYPNFNVVGETWVTEPAYTAAWQKGSRLSKENSYLKTVMDFSFFDKLSKAKKEETDDWWEGWNRLYNSFCYDYLYEDPDHVMAFIDNHDTDRFLENGKDTLALKQALALLLTVKRIPQLYYGTEVLMNGTKEVTDGNVRKDFPGGFPGDERSAFTAEGRTKAENDMFNWLSRLLHWRQNNSVVTKGSMTQFIPYKGVYVIARQYQGKTVLTILNGKKQDNVLDVERYAEMIGSHTSAKDVVTGKTVNLTKPVSLRPRQTLVIEF